MMTDNQTVLATVTFPNSVQSVFDDVRKAGYIIKLFPVREQEALLTQALEMSKEGEPVALICSKLMTEGYSSRNMNLLESSDWDSEYGGIYDGGALARKLNDTVVQDTPTLTVIYSTNVETNLSELERKNSIHSKITVEKTFSDKESNIIVQGLDDFYQKFKVG